MKEFEKIYVAKYQHFLSTRQLSEDLNVSKKEIINVHNELKDNGLDMIYKNIPDSEWEKLQKFKDEQIKFKYYKQSKIIQNRTWKKIINDFNINLLQQFPTYKYSKKEFNRDYFQEENFEDEIWERISILNYEISNYGRIRNINSKKLKSLKFQKYGMQVVLWQNSKGYTITISRLVANIFIRHVNKNERVKHINGNIRDNYYKNLEIVSK